MLFCITIHFEYLVLVFMHLSRHERLLSFSVPSCEERMRRRGSDPSANTTASNAILEVGTTIETTCELLVNYAWRAKSTVKRSHSLACHLPIELYL